MVSDGQLQPFTTVVHAKESSNNSSGSGVEIPCHGLVDITDYATNSSRAEVGENRERGRKQPQNFETARITEIVEPTESKETAKITEIIKPIDETIHSKIIEVEDRTAKAEANKLGTDKIVEITESVIKTEVEETTKQESVQQESTKITKVTDGTINLGTVVENETAKITEVTNGTAKITEIFDDPVPKEPPAKTMTKIVTTVCHGTDTSDMIKTAEIFKSLCESQPQNTNEVASTKIIDVRPQTNKTAESATTTETTKILDVRPKSKQTTETTKILDVRPKSSKTTKITRTTKPEETIETVRTDEPQKQTSKGTFTNVTTTGTTGTTKDSEYLKPTTTTTGVSTYNVSTTKTVETPKANETSDESESDFVVVKKEEIERAIAVPKVTPDLGLIPIKTNDWSSIFEEEDEYYNLIEAAKKAQQRPEIKIDKAEEATENQYSEDLAPNVRKFMEWEDKVLQEMKEDRGWNEIPQQNKGQYYHKYTRFFAK